MKHPDNFGLGKVVVPNCTSTFTDFGVLKVIQCQRAQHLHRMLVSSSSFLSL